MDNEEFDIKDTVDDIIKKSTDFTESIIKKAAEFAQSISQKTSQATIAAKKRFEIEKQQSSLYRKYRELGKAYYSKAKGADVANDVDSLIIEIDTILAAISELEREKEKDPFDEETDFTVDEDEAEEE